MNPIVMHSIIKQRAGQIQRETGLKWHQALDEAAREFGYPNYKNYKNLLDYKRKQTKHSNQALIENISAEKDLVAKLQLAIPFVRDRQTGFGDFFAIVKMFKSSKNMVQKLCENASLQNEIQTHLFNDFLTEEGESEIQIWQPYFKAKKITINDLRYELIDDRLYVIGDYKLITKFAFEIDVNDIDSNDTRFDDQELFGTFDIEIDKNKIITIVHSDLGEEFE